MIYDASKCTTGAVGVFDTENPDVPCDISAPAQVGQPINVTTGEMTHREADLVVQTATGPLTFGRTYKSRRTTTGALGYGWIHNYETSLSTSDGLRYILTLPDGKKAYFARRDLIPYTLPGFIPGPPAPLYGTKGTLAVLPNGELSYAPDAQTQYTYDGSGRLVRIDNAGGARTLLNYATSGVLQSITSADGRTIQFGYDGQNRLQTITDPNTKVITYTYDANGNLFQVIYPNEGSGPPTRTYYYQSFTSEGLSNGNDIHNLTKIVNERGIANNVWSYDTVDRAVLSSSDGGNDKVTLGYAVNSGNVTTTVTNSKTPPQSTTYRSYPQLGQPVVASISGPGCASCGGGDNVAFSYRATPPFALTFTTDRNGIVTQYPDVDSRGNVLTKIEAVSKPEQRTTTYTYHPTLNTPLTITVPSVLGAGNKVTTFDYDSDGNDIPNESPGSLLRRRIEEGFTQDASGATVPFKYVTTYQYTALGQMQQIDGPRTDVSDVTTMDYYPIVAGDPNSGMLHTATTPAGTTTYSNYDWNGNVGRIADVNGIATDYTYESRNRVKTITNASDSSVTTYFYTPTGNIDHIQLPLGNLIAYQYDSADRLTKISDDLGNSINYGYDTESNRTSEQIKDPAGTLKKSLTMTYDDFNRLYHAVNPDSTYTEYLYDGNGNRTNLKDPKGNQTHFDYDALNRLTKVTQNYGGTPAPLTQYGYDGQDNLRTVTDANGNITTTTVDDLGRTVSVASPDTGTTRYSYDPAGNLLTKLDAKAITTTYQYDAANRLTAIQFPDSSQNITYAYDEAASSNGKGRLTSMTDSSGSLRYHYTAKGEVYREEKTIAGVSGTFVTQYSYDKNGNLKTVTYPNGLVVTTGYDTADRATSLTGQSGTTTIPIVNSVTYTPFGGPTSVAMANGLYENRTYDQQYRLWTLAVSNSLENLTYGYEANGNVRTITDNLNPAKNKTYGYDPLDRLTSAIGTWGSLGWTYDNVGNRGTQAETAGMSTYSYFPNTNKLQSITAPQNLSFSYDPNGNTQTDTGRSYTYNQNDRLIQAIQGAVTLGNYVYDGQGKRIKKTANGETRIFFYNQQGQLLSEGLSSGIILADYIYLNGVPVAKFEPDSDLDGLSNEQELDKGTNPLLADTDGDGLTDGEEVFTYHTNPTSPDTDGDGVNDGAEVLAGTDPNSATSYPGDGDINQDGIVNVGDYVLVTRFALGILTPTATQKTHADTNRDGVIDITDVQKIRQKALGLTSWLSVPSVPGKLQYLYAALLPKPDAGVRLTNNHSPLPRSPVRIAMAGMPSGLLLQVGVAPGWLYFIHTDHLGTPQFMTNASGTMVWKADYLPFGEVTLNENPDGDAILVHNNLRFPGQYFDQETGLHQNWYREYAPKVGRYVEADPIGRFGGANPYFYVSNNPIRLIDPSGLFFFPIFVVPPNGAVAGVNIPVPNPENSPVPLPPITYGCFGGGGWTGCYSGLGTPRDSLDECFKAHDDCYGGVPKRTHGGKGTCSPDRSDCDQTLVKCMRKLPPDPHNWDRPPSNPWWANRYRRAADFYFRKSERKLLYIEPPLGLVFIPLL